ncbi:hypothetical protein [Brevibacillus antibioticus]|uniref:hypothetical protein n=1 Tax=Brevibacillus antibioticus TaxID=2570228 RepID=UPI001FCB16B2|nr:hypothetical protein [Brevibacillus antibioticus]
MAMPAAYPVETVGQQNNVVGQVAQPAIPTQKGSLKGTITWQYNDFVGTKPDVNARILLISKGYDKNTLTDDEESIFAIGTVPKKTWDYLLQKQMDMEITRLVTYRLENITSWSYQHKPLAILMSLLMNISQVY